MQTGCVVLYLIFPVISKGCSEKHSQGKKTALQQDQHYRTVDGETFMMPCIGSDKTEWFRTNKGEEQTKKQSFPCKRKFAAEVKHSGTYKSSTSGSRLTLQVVEKISLRCFQRNESSVILRVNVGGKITCPGLTCSNNTNVVWYKERKPVSKQRRRSCEKNGVLQLYDVHEEDTGVFFCDRQIIEEGVSWTFRRAVNVTVVPHVEASVSPEIMYPLANFSEEVELGQSHNLTCKVFFDFEINLSRRVQWFMNHGSNMENMTLLHMEKPQENKASFKKIEVIQRVTIQKVTAQHLKHTYTCIASNTVGNSNVTVRLIRKKQVKWPSLVGYPFACFLLVAGLGIILHVKWLEIQLICRSHFHFGKHDGEEEDFDVFLSYVWSPSPADVSGGLTFSSRLGPKDAAGLSTSTTEKTKTTEAKATQRPIEALLPEVLEDQWGYRLCLLERDLLPGGAYTNDVVLAIKRSCMLICVLSAEYLADSNAVFLLEAGIKVLLQKSALKLLVIWTNGTPASLIQTETPLPKLVQRALKVLPSLNWSSEQSFTATSRFWTSLRRSMPNHRVRVASHTQC